MTGLKWAWRSACIAMLIIAVGCSGEATQDTAKPGTNPSPAPKANPDPGAKIDASKTDKPADMEKDKADPVKSATEKKDASTEAPKKEGDDLLLEPPAIENPAAKKKP